MMKRDPGMSWTSRLVASPDRSREAAFHPSLTGVRGSVKRAMDIGLSIFGLLLLGPLLAVLTWLIRRESPGPAIYRQIRLGLGGREFVILKLRTMRADAELAFGPAWAVDGDPRCTRLGAILRRWGIDELPQLWNVLKGEMSLVGPRPERPEFHACFQMHLPEYDRRLAVRGGIVGLAQIRGWRGDTSIEERLRCDLEYIGGWSIRTDLLVLLLVPHALLRPPNHNREPWPSKTDANFRMQEPVHQGVFVIDGGSRGYSTRRRCGSHQ